jgi:hypothetical protein
MKFKEIANLRESFDDPAIDSYLNSRRSYYIVKPLKSNQLTYAVVLYYINLPNRNYLVYKLDTYNLKAGQDPLAHYAENKNLRNQARYFFTTQERAMRFLMDLKQKFQNKYQLYDIEQLKSRDRDHQQAKKLMTV